MIVQWHLLLYLFILLKMQPQKVNRRNLKAISINWPLLINLKHLTVIIQAIMTIMGDNVAEDTEITEAPVDVEIVEILIRDMTIKNVALEEVKGNVILITVEGVVKIIHIEDDEDSGMVMTQITMTETIGIEIPIVKVILTGVEDGIITVEVKKIVIVEEGDAGIPISSIMIQGINRNLNFKIQITTDHHRWDINTDTQPHMVSIHTRHNNNNTRHKCQRLPNKPLISFNCASQGHYDYQCQFAGDFMARTQKAFNQGRSYSHQDPNQGKWSQGESDNIDPNQQPFQ